MLVLEDAQAAVAAFVQVAKTRETALPRRLLFGRSHGLRLRLRLWSRLLLRLRRGGFFRLRRLNLRGRLGNGRRIDGFGIGGQRSGRRIDARYGLGRDPYESRDNIMAGTAYLREMWDRYGNVGAMLVAYNAGPGRYDEHRATGRPLPAETRAYVAALAPVLGGAAPSDAPSPQPAPPPDWRDAPLFVQRPDGSQSTVAPSSDPQSGDLFAAVSERDRR